MDSVLLSDDQTEHCNRCSTIALNHSAILDTTIGGGGKTLFALYFAYVKGITRILVICPGTLHVAHWTRHSDKYGSPIINIITYDSLRGSKPVTDIYGKDPLSHGYLNKLYNGEYEISDLYRWYIEEGNFMIIIDESHSVKNDSGKTEAVKTLTNHLTVRNMTFPYPKNRSYVYFSSMTPFDEPEHVINFAYLTGSIRSDTLYDKDKDKPTGAEELYQYCRHFSPRESDIIWGTCDVKLRNINDIVYRLMTEVYLKLMSSFAKDCQKNFLSKQSIYYAYFDFDPCDEDEGLELMRTALDMIKAPVKSLGNMSNGANRFLNDAIQQQQNILIQSFNNMSVDIPKIEILRNTSPALGMYRSYTPPTLGIAVQNDYNIPTISSTYIPQIPLINAPKKIFDLGSKFNEMTGGADPPLKDRSGVMLGMTTVQSIKTHYATLKFVRKIFETVRNVKVVIFLSFKESLRMIMRNLAYLNPVSITGEHNCTEDVRNNILAKFNEDNNNYNLLLIISQIGSDGIELDDKFGNRPRIGIAYPDFFNTRFSQCPARILRRFTMSNSLFFFIFMNQNKCHEESVTKSIKNKSKIMDETIRQNGLVPPVYYEKIENPDRLDLNNLLKNAGMQTLKTEIVGQVTANVIQIKKCSVSKTF